MTATGRGQGKVIVCGEHAVVYGHPAIAVAVDRDTTVELSRHDAPTALDPSHPLAADPRVARAIAAVLPGHGLYVAIRSDLPIGRGMGSSAALAVALVRAAARYEGRTLSDDETWERGFAVERIFHGNPSGVDHAVAARGGALWYTRGPPPTFRPLPTPGWSLVVLDSGTAGDTQQMVSGVASRRPGVDADLAAIGALVSRVEAAWSDPPALGALLHENHVLLQRIGVSTPALDALVDLATSHGAWGAKLCGAGGGGVVAALHPDPARLLTAARSAGIDAFEVRAM